MKYGVTYTITLAYTKEVEADNEYEATNIFWKELEALPNSEFYDKCEYVDGETVAQEI